MYIPWEDTRLFLAVAEEGSLTAAARTLGLGQPTVSRRLAQLEDALGFQVFERSTGGATLTSKGERLLEPARRMAEWAAELERAAEGGNPAPRGVVRISAPPGVAFDFLAPFAASLRKRHPEIQLQVLSAIRYVDLARREADLALRTEAAAHRDLTTLGSLELDAAAYATPAYTARLPAGYGAADVDWIAWAPPYEHLAPNPQLEVLVPGFRPSFASDDFLVKWRAAEDGVGAMVLGRMEHRLARRRRLVPLDLDLGAHARSSLHLVCAKSALDIPRVRVVAQALIAELDAVQR